MVPVIVFAICNVTPFSNMLYFWGNGGSTKFKPQALQHFRIGREIVTGTRNIKEQLADMDLQIIIGTREFLDWIVAIIR